MNDRIEYWKPRLEHLRMAPSVNWNEAGRIAAEICRDSTNATLRHAAEQALPVMHQAALNGADSDMIAAALRCLGGILEIINGRAAPSFGRRNIVISEQATPEERARKALGLPLAVQLTCDDIHRAYRRLAKTMHPDHGGSEQAFLDLTAARDLLIHPRAHKNG